MGWIERQRLRLAAALSPNMMSRQISKPKNLGEDNIFNLKYKDDDLCYEDYDKMLMDSQIKSGYELLRMFLLSRKIVVTPASEDEADGDIANKIEEMLNTMDYPLRKVRNDMYSALIYGYSVSEMVWGVEDSAESLVNIRRIRPIPIDTLEDCFRYDDMGNVTKIVQTIDDEEIEIPAEKCLIYTYDECFGDREGKSILDGVYENWFQKQKLLTLWNIFLQKHEGPTLVGKVENPMFKDAMREQLDEIHDGRTNITVGMNDDVSVLESGKDGTGFKDAIEYHDTMIFRKMNIGTMILGQQDGAGAYAQSQTQFDTLSIFLDGIHEDMAVELQSKINELVDMNWNVDDYPVIGFETFEEKDLLGLLAALKPMIDATAVNPQDMWFRHLLADIVSRYSDVDVAELLEERQEEPDLIPGAEVQPTPEEQVAPVAEEQTQLIEDVAKQIPPKTEDTGAPPTVQE